MKNIIFTLGLLLAFSNLHADDVLSGLMQKPEKPVDIVVYRSPACGCCGKWLQHLKAHHFNVHDVITENMDAIKQQYGVPVNLASCHTAIAEGYIVEGHVPAADIKKMLKDKPDILGLTVPGMVTGTPGMEMGGKKDPFDVIAFDINGKFKLFNHYKKY